LHHGKLRREAPEVNSPALQRGVRAPVNDARRAGTSSIFSVPHLRRSTTLHLYPGLTAGPMYCLPFGPDRTVNQPLDTISSPRSLQEPKANSRARAARYQASPKGIRILTRICGIILCMDAGLSPHASTCDGNSTPVLARHSAADLISCISNSL